MHIGDFHFLWECAKVLLLAFWEKVTLPGLLSNLRAYVNRTLVDKKGKTFNVIDEFMQQAYAAHLLTAICEELQLESPHDDIPHEESHAWLQATIVKKRIMPSESTDPVNALHRCFLYAGFMYIDLRNAIRDGEGEQIVRNWRHWLILFLGTNRKNYANEAVIHLSNLAATYPRHISQYIIEV